MNNTLFENEENEWQKEWKDMPEFIQEKKVAYRKIIISFDSEDDIKEFGKLINQKITNKTKSIWFPFKIKDNRKIRAYVEEN